MEPNLGADIPAQNKHKDDGNDNKKRHNFTMILLTNSMTKTPVAMRHIKIMRFDSVRVICLKLHNVFIDSPNN